MESDTREVSPGTEVSSADLLIRMVYNNGNGRTVLCYGPVAFSKLQS